MKKYPVWQKRFKKKIIPLVLQFTGSICDDEVLVPYDIVSSLTHTEMLARKKVISQSDGNKIKNGLKKILSEYKKGKFKLVPEYEDVHMNIEFQLKKMLGETAEKLHTARSRNDLIATELRMYCRDAINKILRNIVELQKVIIKQTERHRAVVIPGYTHLQQAQPILASFYLASYFYKFQRDFEQLQGLNRWIKILPLGSCAIAGTSIQIDREFLAKKLGFDKVCENALDGVSDRDFLIDTLYYIARILLHISNLATDVIIYSTGEFKLVYLDDSIVTGSSIMPQKRNPDVYEILRAKSGRAMGNLMSGLSIIKGITTSYNRDLQELKSILFNQIKECLDCLDIVRVALLNTNFLIAEEWQNKPDFICTTDLVEFFVKKGYRFRNIYNLIANCIKKSNGDIEKFITLLSKKTQLSCQTIKENMTPRFSVNAKISRGSTGRSEMEMTLNLMKKCVSNNLRELKSI